MCSSTIVEQLEELSLDVCYCGPRHAFNVAHALVKTHLPDLKIDMAVIRTLSTGFVPALTACQVLCLAILTLTETALSEEAANLSAKNTVCFTDEQRGPDTAASSLNADRWRDDCIRVGALDRVVTYETGKLLAECLARRYLSSRPADPSSPNDRATRDVKMLAQGRLHDKRKIQNAFHLLDYRMNIIMATASFYRTVLKKDFPDCEEVDVGHWSIGMLNWQDERKMRETWDFAYEQLVDAELFDEPNAQEGTRYRKGERYLATLMTYCMQDEQQIMDSIALLSHCNRSFGRVADTIRTLKLSKHLRSRRLFQAIGHIDKVVSHDPSHGSRAT